jgi:hypothetical protein
VRRTLELNFILARGRFDEVMLHLAIIFHLRKQTGCQQSLKMRTVRWVIMMLSLRLQPAQVFFKGRRNVRITRKSSPQSDFFVVILPSDKATHVNIVDFTALPFNCVK